MSELKVASLFELEKVLKGSSNKLFYSKSEADKVIAELERRLNEAHTELELWRDGSIISEEHQKELDGKRHADYKWCLAMADGCRAKIKYWHMRYITAAGYDRSYEKWKHRLLIKWHKRWLAIADKFKETK